MQPKKTKGSALLRVPGRVIAFLLLTVLLGMLVLGGAVFVALRGPSPTVSALLYQTLRETESLRPLAERFSTEEQLAAAENPADDTETEENMSLIHTDSARSELPYLSIEDVKGSTYKGKMMIVRDAKSLLVGTADASESEGGQHVSEFLRKYDGIAAVNGGAASEDGAPKGLLISRGAILYGNENGRYSVAGITEDGVLLVGNMTGREALEKHIRWAVSYCADGMPGGALLINGEMQEANLASGLRARTAIGQRADGTILLLVLDGGRIGSLGATRTDLCAVMLAYGAVNAAELESGAASAMVNRGETVSTRAILTAARKVPDAFVVLREGSYE